MGYSSHKITPPVSISDVQSALNTNLNSLGDLCTAQGINVWAKYKPVRFGAIDTTKDPSTSVAWLDSNKLWNSNAYWWRNPSGVYGATLYCCGFSIPGLSGVTSSIATDLGQWEYLRPRGGSYNEPYRQLDFNQYYADAVCPFRVELPARAVLSNSLLRGKCFIRTTAGLDALNLTKDDLFAQFGSTAYYGIAAVNGTNVYAKTVDDNSPLVSLEGLETAMSLTAGDKITLVAFATRTKSTSWTTGQYQVYSLNAPDIDFAVVGECEVVTVRDTVYLLVVSGFETRDRLVLRPGAATLSNSTVTATNRGTSNPHYSYQAEYAVCRVEKVDENGDVTFVDEKIYNSITISPDYVEPNGGTYSQISCENLYPVASLPTIQDPTKEFYQITYTIHYVRD